MKNPVELRGSERAAYVQEMFTRIAGRYDLMNRLMTAGQDVRWRREVIRRAALPAGGRLLDLGAGTGDMALEALRQQPACRPVAADFTLAMMQVGMRRQRKRNAGAAFPVWSAADALSLPFADRSFDAAVSGFLMRNVSDVLQALREQSRVLRPGGRIVVLDTTRPSRNLLTPFINIHLGYIIPTLGRLLTGQADAYNYLPDSTQAFLTAEQLAQRMQEAGFQQVGFRRLMFGTIAIHWGEKGITTETQSARSEDCLPQSAQRKFLERRREYCLSLDNKERDMEKAALRGEPSYVWRKGQQRRLEMIAAAAQERLRGVVLDNGCGVGMYVEHLAPYGGKVVGMEYDVERAVEAHQASPSILSAAGEALPFAEGTFDLMLSHEVLEHVQDDRRAVREMVRALRPGGRLALFVPNRGYPFETHGIFWRGRYRFGNIPLVNYLPRGLRDRLAPHVRVYSRGDLEKLFAGLPVRIVTRTVIFGAYDNIIARYPGPGRLLRAVLQALEKSPLRGLGLSHFWVVEKLK